MRQMLNPATSPWLAILLTLLMVIVVREAAVLLCRALGIASAANIVGLVIMFVLLMVWRFWQGLPAWMTGASNTLLVDSGFAFLPISAGAGLLLFALGEEFWAVVIIMLVSTLIPLWGFAKLANRWLNEPPSVSIVSSVGNEVVAKPDQAASTSTNTNADKEQSHG